MPEASMILTRPPHLAAWTDALDRLESPILPSTAADIALLHSIEEANGTVDAHMLAECMNHDPLMTLKVLSHVSRYCTRLSVDPPETLVGALVMMGIGPFFKVFANQQTIVEWLCLFPEALAGITSVVTRARRASNFAMGFALRRQDEDAVVIHEAALLHDFAEMLLWCHAPVMALEISERLAADHTLRSADVQREVLGIELNDLAQSLMHRWQLPDLIIKATDDRQAHVPQVRSVHLAVQIARHTQHGWDDPHALAAMRDDVAGVAQLLNLSQEAAERLIRGMDD
ncbi:HDOD domain-containing protein [Aquabacterium sp.]|jgi:HD-like signal output (HDOD) protein|uniref:HDOD domain-containing protein n=1 Tax=Aquabacterium sp. TaxID=1872578 RepID=UPI0025B9292B|nr:HDOD domain-containing protein [Aquabacterium sp.]